MPLRKYALFLSGFLASASPALAQDAEIPTGDTCCDEQILPLGMRFEPITVVGTGLALPLDGTGQPISIIDRAEIDAVQGPDLTRVLQRLAGTTVTRNGPLGGFTGVFVRGASSEQLLVLVDGVRVNDVAAPGGGFDFGNILSGSIERVELLRGPNSLVWGSDAMGGVVNLLTRAPDGVEASAEYGAHETLYATLGGGIDKGALDLGMTASYLDSDGFSAAAGGSEDDGFRQYQVTGRARLDAGGGFAIVANGRFADSKLEQDGYEWSPPYAFVDTLDLQDTREWSGRLGAEYISEALSLRAGYSVTSTERAYTGESYGDFPYATDGLAKRAELFGRYAIAGPLKLDFGADREWSNFRDSGTRQAAHTTSAHALLGWYGEQITLSAGLRHDDNSLFGGEWTLGANGSLRFARDWRLRASYGEGFKAPSLYQLYSFYGDTALNPETSKGYDIGIEKGDRSGPFFASLSAFRRDSRNLIDFDLFDFVYYNIGRARAQGAEFELAVRPSGTLRAALVYSFVDTEDRTPGSFYEGNDLHRRPRHSVTASADWSTPLGLVLGGDVRLVGDSFDDRGEFVPLDGFATADLRASMPLGENFEVYGRIENLFDADYTTVAGYNTQGRAAHVGARIRM